VPLRNPLGSKHHPERRVLVVLCTNETIVYVFIYFFIFLSVESSLSIYLYIHPSIHSYNKSELSISVFVSMYVSIYLSAYICISIVLSIYLSICLSIYLPSYLSSQLSIYQTIYLSVHLSYMIYQSISSYRTLSYLISSYLSILSVSSIRGHYFTNLNNGTAIWEIAQNHHRCVYVALFDPPKRLVYTVCKVDGTAPKNGLVRGP